MRSKNRVIYFLIILAAGLIIGPSKAESVEPLPQAVLGIEDAVINVAATSGRAVVSVSTERTEHLDQGNVKKFHFEGPSGNSPLGNDPFDRFFDDFFGGMPREFKQQGLGSGVIIDEQGYILTNEHVIDEADKITVKLYDGREFKAQLKGRDMRSDLAVIKISW